MMKFVKKLSIITVFLFTFLIIGVQVGEVNAATSDNGSSTDILSDPNILARFPQLENERSQDIKLVESKEIYVNYVKTVDSKTGSASEVIKEYNQKQYKQLNIQDQINEINKTNSSISTKSISVSVPKQNSWIRITLSVYSDGASTFRVYGYYTWLTSPMVFGNDIIALSHDSHMTFDYSSAWSQYVWTDGGFGTPKAFTQHRTTLEHSSSRFTGDIGGASFSFPLGSGVGIDSDGTSVYPYGLMYIGATKGNSGDTSAEMGLTYAHQKAKISGNPVIKIPLGTSITIKVESAYSKFNLPYTVRY